METWQERTIRMVGTDAVSRLNRTRVAVFGLGGVGSYTAEALVRAGIGTVLFVDSEEVDVTNINRQLIATRETIGQSKVECAKKRALSINPSLNIQTKQIFFSKETANEIDFSAFDCVADCIDSVSAKILLIEKAKAANAYIVSCMGTGNKLDPTRFKVADIEKTDVCPLARVMRRELKKRNVKNVRCVYSDELPVKPDGDARVPSSISFVPGAAGLILAGEIIKHIMSEA
ncbi:MAG: tRNA threonylcarbamoyladenosine dehydratase [Clostridiales bacterium]|nr:tRNA threonylcarbamoyladenosine dehydratase [Clostridiales bacterium]